MKRILFAAIASGLAMSSFGQTDSTKKTEPADTIKIGGMIIVKDGETDSTGKKERHRTISISNRGWNKHVTKANVSTNWWILDLGFANYSDNTNYGSTSAQAFAPGLNKEALKLRTGKSVNVNIWFFMQKLNIAKHVLNFKYGLGMELNNYRFDDERVHFTKNPTIVTLDPDYKDVVKKNKLAADYLTVPMMLNVNFTPGRNRGFGFSAGVSGGYLISSRQKIKKGNDKDKVRDDFDLRKFKLSYIGELGLGPVRLYGSYAMKSMWDKGLDQTPYSIGFRLSRW
jgi:hypothetical protein